MRDVISILVVFGTVLLNVVMAPAVHGQAFADLEAGVVFTGYNDVRIPGNTGTLLSLNDELQTQPNAFYRIRLGYTIDSRHTISLLYAPLVTESNGSVTRDVVFEGLVFPAHSSIASSYKFNSYRFTYRYDIVKSPSVEFGLGITAKIRDARIALSSSGLAAEKVNVGFVPLVNFRLQWNIDSSFGFLLDGDALAAPQGRAEDVLVAATYMLTDKMKIRAGYRILEGGAGNDEVYTFSLFHYATIGLTYTFAGTN